MNFKKKGELKRLLIFAIFILFCFTLYVVFAQESTTTSSDETTTTATSSESATADEDSSTTTPPTETPSSTAATPTTPSITLVTINNPSDKDYEGYQLLDMDDDSSLTEEDIYLKLKEINNQISGANTYLTYLQDVHGLSFTLTPITTNTSVRDSANSVDLGTNLQTTRVQLENLAEEIDTIQGYIGHLAEQDPAVAPITGYFNDLDYNIYLAMTLSIYRHL